LEGVRFAKKKVVKEDRYVPFDTKRRITAPRSKKHGHMNNVFNGDNQDSGTTQAASGFWGDTNTKMNTFVGILPKIKSGGKIKASIKKKR